MEEIKQTTITHILQSRLPKAKIGETYHEYVERNIQKYTEMYIECLKFNDSFGLLYAPLSEVLREDKLTVERFAELIVTPLFENLSYADFEDMKEICGYDY